VAFIVSSTLWGVGMPLAHGVLPWAVSLLGRRHGWTPGPGTWNLLGLIPLAVGIACLLWVMLSHFARTPARVELEWTPQYLLIRGPYVFTRNPMYVGELALWFGWALFYGSGAVLLACAVLWVAMNWLAIPREEGALEARFGEAYLQYKRTVPRWLGRTRH
jgi:protein-S-isoprenylcysteine O-methyltransferase Ste14